VTVPGLGLTLGHGMSRFESAANHPNSAGPGKRPLHNMCPTIVFRGADELLSLGGAGGRAIPSAIFSVLANYIGGDSLEESVAAPRCATQGTLNVTVDRLWAEKDVEALKNVGYAVKSGEVANVCAISRDAKTGECRGAAR
jgi:gamma-glutamyltranspeptidase / glutathione hydrolase